MNAHTARSTRQLYARTAGWVTTSRSTSLGRNDECDGRGTQKGGVPVRRIGSFGLRFVPPDGSEGIIVTINGGRRTGGAAALIATENLKYGPQELKGGEVALYSQYDATILLDKDGNITVVPKAGAKVKLGTATDSDLDPVVLYQQLKTEFDGFVDTFNMHGHYAGALAAGMTPVTGTTAGTTLSANHLTSAAGSSNVEAKK